MPNPNRRTVLRGAGIAFGASVAAVGVAGPAAAQPDPDPQDLAHLRRTFVLAEQARQAGGAPYGADLPFGGFKYSGIGRQNGTSGFDQYLERKSYAWPAT